MLIAFKRTLIASLVAASWPALAQSVPSINPPEQPKDAAAQDTPKAKRVNSPRNSGTPEGLKTEERHIDTLQTVVVAAKRAQRISKGATGLPLEIKDTPQSISTIDAQILSNFGLTDVNDALRLGTGINVDQYETNRATFNSRGFEIQLTQIDGLGVSNDWGTVVGQQDTYLFERIELIRGANGLLTGVGNASGTINYVRKRPKNAEATEVGVAFGSWNKRRVTLDANRLLSTDGDWAARLVVAYEDKDSYLRALHDRRASVYAVVDGAIGRDGVLTAGFAHTDAKQASPMWGSLTLNYADGRRADFDVSSSTSQDWTYWNTRSSNVFAEYTHRLGADWEGKATLTHRTGDEATKLFYAYVAGFGPGLNPDNTGLAGWPYRSKGTASSTVLDANLTGRFEAFGGRHESIFGVSQSRQKHDSDFYPVDPSLISQPLPAFPYAGNVFPEPAWDAPTDASAGSQRLTRMYGAARLSLTPSLKTILGVNAIRLNREGQSRFGSQGAVTDPKTTEISPYVGVTYDLTPDMLAYASYSDIFLSQDQTDINGVNLAPVRGVNAEAGLKAEWLNRKLLTTFALFSAKQDGLATYAGITPSGQFFYAPRDVTSRGVEFEVTGKPTARSSVAVGVTRLKLTGPDGNDIYEWVPRTTAKLRFDTSFDALPALSTGASLRWQSKTSRLGAIEQEAYAVVDGFFAYQLTDAATLRFNVNNLLDKKYVHGLAYGAIYGPPRHYAVSLAYRL